MLWYVFLWVVISGNFILLRSYNVPFWVALVVVFSISVPVVAIQFMLLTKRELQKKVDVCKAFHAHHVLSTAAPTEIRLEGNYFEEH